MLTYYIGHWLFPALFGKIAFIITNNIHTSVCLADFELYGVTIAETGDPNLLAPDYVEASAEGLSNTELINRIYDGKYLTLYRANFAEPISITYTYADNTGVSINAYSITASKNEVTRDPADWTLEGSNDGTTWTLLDNRSNETFSQRYATQFYFVESMESYQQYRLTINKLNGGNQLQLGELQLLNIQPVDPTGIDHRQITIDNRQTIYNLSGQRLSKPQRGINIINGKKLLIK